MKRPLASLEAGASSNEQFSDSGITALSNSPAPRQVQNDTNSGCDRPQKTQARVSKWRTVYKVHPAADVFPMMSEQELRKLAENIKANELRERVRFWRDDLIDGRNRMEALEIAGIEVRAEHRHQIDFNADPVVYIISANLHRRHLTKIQIAEIIVADVLRKYFANDGEVSEKVEVLVPCGQPTGMFIPRDVVDKLSKGGRGNVNKMKATAVSKAAEHTVSKRTVERAFERAAPTAPRPKAARQRSKAAPLSRMAPATVDGWRRGYINACKIGCPDLDTELQAITDALREIAGKRALGAGKAVPK